MIVVGDGPGVFSLGGIIQRWPAVLEEGGRFGTPCLSGDGTLFSESFLSPLLSEFHSPPSQGKDGDVPQLRGVTEKRPSRRSWVLPTSPGGLDVTVLCGPRQWGVCTLPVCACTA